MDPGHPLPEKVFDKIIDLLVSDALADGDGRKLHAYALVNRYWALHIRPAILGYCLITQETAEPFLHFAQSHAVQPNIRDCAVHLHIVLDISMVDCTPWFHEVMKLLRVGAFPSLEEYLIEDYSSFVGDGNLTRRLCEDGEVQVQGLIPSCTPVPHDRCRRAYRGHRLQTLGTFLDLIDHEDGAVLHCLDVKWLQRIDPQQATILANKRGYRRSRFEERCMVVDDCSVVWPLLLAFVTTGQSEPLVRQSPAYIHHDELPKVLKLFESFTDKCTCCFCYCPKGAVPSNKRYYLGQKLDTEAPKNAIVAWVENLDKWHMLGVLITVSGLVSLIHLELSYHAICGHRCLLSAALLTQFDKHAVVIGREGAGVTIAVDGVEEEEMLIFVLNTVHYMPRLYAANRLFFSYQTKEDSHLQRDRFRRCQSAYIRQLVQELSILGSGAAGINSAKPPPFKRLRNLFRRGLTPFGATGNFTPIVSSNLPLFSTPDIKRILRRGLFTYPIAPWELFPEELLGQIIDRLASEMIAGGAVVQLRTYSLVNRFWALRIRPRVFSDVVVTQSKAKLFLDFVNSRNVRPNIRQTVKDLRIVTGDSLSTASCAPWYRKILDLISEGAFPNLENSELRDSQTLQGKIRPSYNDGELHLRRVTSHCSSIPYEGSVRIYYGHRSQTLKTFLDYLDAEDSSKIGCHEIKWLKKMTLSEACVLAGRRGYRPHRFNMTRQIITNGCSAAWPMLLLLIATEQPRLTSARFPIYIRPSLLLGVLKLVECFTDKCSCFCCYRPRGTDPSKIYYLCHWQHPAVDRKAIWIAAHVFKRHWVAVLVEPSGSISRVEFRLSYNMIPPYRRALDPAFLAQLEKHTVTAWGTSRPVQISVDNIGHVEMREFVHSASRYMPDLCQTGRLSFLYRTKRDPPNTFYKFVEDSPSVDTQEPGGSSASS